MPLSDHYRQNIKQILDDFLDNIQILTIDDFLIVSKQLKKIINYKPINTTSCSISIHKSLKLLQTLIDYPEKFVTNDEDYIEYQDLLSEHIRKKIVELNSLNRQQKISYINNIRNQDLTLYTQLKQKFNNIAFYISVKKEQENAIINFLNHGSINPNKSMVSTNNALTFAIQYSSLEIIQLLLSYDSIDPNQFISPGENPLLITIQDNRDCKLDIIEELLKHPQINLNVTTHDGATPLLIAVEEDDITLVQMLLTHPQTDLNLPDFNGISPLELAINRNNIDIIKILLTDSRIQLNTKNASQQTPFELAILSNNNEIIQELCRCPLVNPCLLSENGKKTLYYAVIQKDFDLIKILINNPYIINDEKSHIDNPDYLFNVQNYADFTHKLLQHKPIRDYYLTEMISNPNFLINYFGSNSLFETELRAHKESIWESLQELEHNVISEPEYLNILEKILVSRAGPKHPLYFIFSPPYGGNQIMNEIYDRFHRASHTYRP